MKTEWEEGMEIVERKITIDPELSALIPPLTGDEYTLLEESILAEGCRDALIVWQGILIDGHNRYKICREHGLSFRVEEARVSSRAEAMAWMAKNQLGRRNLNNFQRAELALVYKPAIEAEADLQIGDKSFRNQHRGSHIDLRRPGAFSLLHFPTRAHLDHGFFQHGLVEFVAHFLDVAGLLFAQKIAGAADIEVVTGQGKACTQRVE